MKGKLEDNIKTDIRQVDFEDGRWMALDSDRVQWPRFAASESDLREGWFWHGEYFTCL